MNLTYDEFYEKYYKFIRSVINKFKFKTSKEDVLQDVMIEIWQNYERIRNTDIKNEKAYVRAIVRYHCIAQIRHEHEKGLYICNSDDVMERFGNNSMLYNIETITTQKGEIIVLDEYIKKYRKKRAEYSREYYKKNKEKELARGKKYQQEHKEQFKEYNKKYRERHKEEIAERQRKWRKKNKDKVKEHAKKYQKEHKEKLASYQREYRQKNRDKIKERDKKYREEHKEEYIAYQREYRKKKKEEKLNNKTIINPKKSKTQ